MHLHVELGAEQKVTGLPIEFLYSAALLEVYFVDANGSIHEKNGTGFFVGKSNEVYLVSNRHVFDAKWDTPNTEKNSVKFRQYEIEKIICRRYNKGILERHGVEGKVTFSNREIDDVAVIKVDSFYPVDGVQFSNHVAHFFNFEDLADKERIQSEVLPCDQVVFPSFGEGYSEIDSRPIFRVGWVVSDPTVPLNHRHIQGDAFLFEGFSTGGASGAPVIALPVGLKLGEGITKDGGRGFRDWCVLGVNAGRLESPEFMHSQVSYAFKASLVRQLIELAETQ